MNENSKWRVTYRAPSHDEELVEIGWGLALLISTIAGLNHEGKTIVGIAYWELYSDG